MSCEALQMIVVLSTVLAFIGFVVGINWWAKVDAARMLDRVYGKSVNNSQENHKWLD